MKKNINFRADEEFIKLFKEELKKDPYYGSLTQFFIIQMANYMRYKEK